MEKVACNESNLGYVDSEPSNTLLKMVEERDSYADVAYADDEIVIEAELPF